MLYYIAPQLWAWRPGRARRFASAVDRLAVVLPFEQRFFGRLGLRSDYVAIPWWTGVPGRRAPRRVPASARPGRESRAGPLPRQPAPGDRPALGTVSGRCARLLAEGRCDRVVVAGTATGEYPDPGPLAIERGDPMPVFAAADAALAKSGTATLEAALADVPMVVAYKVHPVTWHMFQRLRTVELGRLVNLVAEREVVPEMLQDRAEAGQLADALRPLLDPDDPRTVAQHAGLALVRERLGAPGATTRVVAWWTSSCAREAVKLRSRRRPLECWPARHFAPWRPPGASARSMSSGGGRCTRLRRPHVFLLWHEALCRCCGITAGNPSPSS